MKNIRPLGKDESAQIFGGECVDNPRMSRADTYGGVKSSNDVAYDVYGNSGSKSIGWLNDGSSGGDVTIADYYSQGYNYCIQPTLQQVGGYGVYNPFLNMNVLVRYD